MESFIDKKIRKLDKKLFRINCMLNEEKNIQIISLNKLKFYLEKESLTELEICEINDILKGYSYPAYFVNDYFIKICFWGINNGFNNSVLNLLETIISRSEFNYFLSDDVMKSAIDFVSFYNKTDNLNMLALINYLLDKNFIMEKVIESSKNGVKLVAPKVFMLCSFLESNNMELDDNYKVFVYRHN